MRQQAEQAKAAEEKAISDGGGDKKDEPSQKSIVSINN